MIEFESFEKTPLKWGFHSALVVLLAICGSDCLSEEPALLPALQQLAVSREHYRIVHSLDWSPDSRSLLSGSSDFCEILWANPDLDSSHRLPRHRGSVYSVAFSPSGRLFAGAGHHGQVRVYATGSRELLNEIHIGTVPVFSITFFGDDEHLLLGTENGRMEVWDSTEARLLDRHECGARVSRVVYSPSARLIAASVTQQDTSATSGTRNIRLLRYVDGTLISTTGLESDTAGESALAFSSSGRWIATGGSRGYGIRIWDVENRTLLREFDEPHGVSTTSIHFSPDEQILASTGQDATVRLWAVKTGFLLREFDPFSNGVGHCVRFSPDGRYLAAGGGYEPGEIIVWRISEAAE